VVVVEFADLQCPVCGSFERQVMPKLIATYVDTGRVALVFRHHPLSEIHPLADKASIVTLCSGRQGHFWDLERTILEDQTHLQPDDLLRTAGHLGVNVGELTGCMADKNVEASISADTHQAESLGLSGTPSFLIGTRVAADSVRVRKVFVGAPSFQDVATAIDTLLPAGNRAPTPRW
jgi:protein-disulfide isomerase